ncbi:hypothetical protein [Solemya elarraichensis gill symbiont]|uniref:hypothetical protein n=1 Tax=Solemya elarraichensis gill symbiont TaxID=1918949 RepID=UPI000998B313|nr:hypothetical protein [Solemya elarraichensis gill symbiont]
MSIGRQIDLGHLGEGDTLSDAQRSAELVAQKLVLFLERLETLHAALQKKVFLVQAPVFIKQVVVVRDGFGGPVDEIPGGFSSQLSRVIDKGDRISERLQAIVTAMIDHHQGNRNSYT